MDDFPKMLLFRRKCRSRAAGKTKAIWDASMQSPKVVTASLFPAIKRNTSADAIRRLIPITL